MGRLLRVSSVGAFVLIASLVVTGCYDGLDASDGGAADVGDGDGDGDADSDADADGDADGDTDGDADGDADADGDGDADGDADTDADADADGDADADADADTDGDADGDADSDSDADADTDADGDGDGDDTIPNVPYCQPTANWQWPTQEEQVLALVNQRRAMGANCGSQGSFGPAGALTMEYRLRCAARMHSLDMYERDFFDHTNPDGEGPAQRVNKTGYQWTTIGENIAYGYQTPEQVMQGWMGSDGHCSNIMNPNFTEIGVGLHGGGLQWTQVFGRQ